MRFVFADDFVVDSAVEPWRREGLRVGVFGGPGSTKSYRVAASLVEPFLEEGGSVIIFEPRAEWHTLKSKYPDVQVVGGPLNQDIPFTASHPKLYADAVSSGISMVFYTGDAPDEEHLVSFAERFLEYVMKQQEVEKRPLMIVFEEAHQYAPSQTKGHTAPPWVFARMVKKIQDCYTDGRKLNITPVSISQRPQGLAFTVRQLCNLTLYGQFPAQDLGYIDKECLQTYRRDGLNVHGDGLKVLPPGRFLAIHHTSAGYVDCTQKRITPHGADTPTLEYVPPPSEHTKATVSNLGQKLKELLEKQAEEESELAKAKRTISTQAKELEDLNEKMKTAGNIRELLLHGNGPSQEALDVLVKEKERLETRLKQTEKDKYGWEKQAATSRGELEKEKQRHEAMLADALRQAEKFEKYQAFESFFREMQAPIIDAVIADFEQKWATKIAVQVQENLERKGIGAYTQGGNLMVEAQAADISVAIERTPVPVKEDTVEGQLALLVLDKFFDKPRRASHATKELKQGWRNVDYKIVEKKLEELALPPFHILERKETTAGGAEYQKATGPRAGRVKT